MLKVTVSKVGFVIYLCGVTYGGTNAFLNLGRWVGVAISMQEHLGSCQNDLKIQFPIKLQSS